MKRLLSALTLAVTAAGLVAQEPVAREKNEVWDLISSQNDKNKDGRVTAAEYTRGEVRFKRLDRNGDGVLTLADFQRPRGPGGRGGGRGMSASFVFGRLMDADQNDEVTKEEVTSWIKSRDRNEDGKVSRDEFQNRSRARAVLRMFDADGDGSVSSQEFEKSFDEAAGKAGVIRVESRRRPRGGGGRAGGRSRPADGAPKVGVVAPDFTLTYKDGKKKAKLSSFKGKKPVALIFGSYT